MESALVSKVYENNWDSHFEMIIVLPTFNRIKNLMKVLDRLLISMREKVGLIILDNASDNFDLDKLLAFLENYDGSILVYRNQYNIGADANIIRSMELASIYSSWLYIIGDSKLPISNLPRKLLQIIEELNDDVNAVLFSFDSKTNKDSEVQTIKDLVRSKVKFGDVLLVGNSIIRTSTLIENFSTYYQLSIARSVIPVIVFLNLHQGGKIKVTERTIIDMALSKPSSYSPGLSLLECWRSFPLLVALPVSSRDKREILQFVNRNESRRDKVVFVKFCLLKIFKEKVDISGELLLTLKYRYSLRTFHMDYFFLFPLLIISKLHNSYEKMVTR